MRNKIGASWVVGHKNSGYVLFRDAVVVYEENRIIHVGGCFEGTVDETIDALGTLVCPGLSRPTFTPATAHPTG